jgi:hypothetical protein
MKFAEVDSQMTVELAVALIHLLLDVYLIKILII